MSRAEIARPAANGDFWPAQNLDAWRSEPRNCFLSWLAEQRVLGVRQLRESSCETYTAMFSAWLTVLEKERGVSLLEAAPKDAAYFFETHKIDRVSRRRYLHLLNKVYRYLRGIGWSGENPLLAELRNDAGTIDIALPPGLDEASLEKVITVLTALPGWKGARDRCAAALLIGAGLRANEFIDLQQGDVSPHYEILVKPHTVHKEHSTLILPEGPWRSWYKAWEHERAELKFKKEAGSVLCPGTLSGRPYTPSGLFRRVNEWLQPIASELPQAGPNILRNTFARLALTCDRYTPEQVQEFLGHVEFRTTFRHLSAINTSAP